ncbi:hypothetical protein C2845_PM05G23430 [Panicum miliaceum]|uniref:Uncharacterized protein n=1 Tax=Panicum miliaceum TaxID=4540 RepID=A0A3L6SXH1_PANMI|nr:hypothetical protein C2845_PM05G23430 [Panicum miliaceum]
MKQVKRTREMKMWVESRPARSKPEGVTASRHADPLVLSVHTTMLPSSSSSRASAYCARVPSTRMSKKNIQNQRNFEFTFKTKTKRFRARFGS